MREDSSFFNSFNSVVRTIFESLGISPNVAEEFECWIFILFLIIVSIFLSWLLRILLIFVFSRIFKSYVGHSPTEYINKYRIEKAAELFLCDSNSVTSVASAVGIDDPNYFTRLFKRFFNMSPREYKRKKLDIYNDE